MTWLATGARWQLNKEIILKIRQISYVYFLPCLKIFHRITGKNFFIGQSQALCIKFKLDEERHLIEVVTSRRLRGDKKCTWRETDIGQTTRGTKDHPASYLHIFFQQVYS